jgi:chlorobactene glucosyltransferase
VSSEERVAWLLAALQLARAAWAHRQSSRMERIAPQPVPDTARTYPRLSVVVPARNEERTIAACLAALRAQAYPDLEIVVVDDRSDDATAAIVRAAAEQDERVKLVEGEPLPAGWIGKCWALHQGSAAATGEWLLFVDADTRLLPGAATGALEEARRRGVPVLSALTAQELPTAWERALMPAVFAALAEALPVELVNDPDVPQVAIANGQFLLVRRDAYDGIGGHVAIRDEIGEDAKFAQRAKQLRWRYWLGDGRDLATTRMYTRPAEFWEGWTKNLHTGARLVPWLIPPGLVVYLAGLVAPFWSIARSRQIDSPSLAVAGLLQLVVALALRRRVDRTFGVPWPYAFTQPVGQVTFLALLTASFWKVLTGQGVTWKGRRYHAAG